MKITRENFKDFIEFDDSFSKESYVNSLLDDVDEINKIIKNSNFEQKPEFYIDIQLHHDEYSPERTDPCPDFFGYLSIRGTVFNEDGNIVRDGIVGDLKKSLSEIDYDLYSIYSILDFIK